VATKYYCDLCNREVPIQTALKPLSIGDKKIVDLCFECSNKITTVIEAEKKRVAEALAGSQPAKPEEQPKEEVKENG